MKLLVVDDEFVSRSTLKAFGTKIGYETIEAKDGLEAYEIWARERPRLVVTDWNMPNMDGLELCRRIREEEGDDYTYLVIVTARGDGQDIVEGLNSGADEFLSKPFNRDELFARLKSGERILNMQSKDLVIFALARLSESRDEDTGLHLERIRHYSKTLAETRLAMPDPPPELNPLMISNIFLTSPLHDIGKVGIPDYILLKPGRLDDEEFGIMKSHTFIGWQTLDEVFQKSPKALYLQVGAEIAYQHHEKWNGTGYPRRLKGEEISLSARFVALADVYDALVSRRPYKPAFSHERAKSIILEGRDTHFDPQVIDAFLQCESQFLEIHHQFKEPDGPE